MRKIPIGVSSMMASCLAYGCWRVLGTWNPSEVTPENRKAGKLAIQAAFESGYTLFDNADIYCGGEAEKLLGEVLKETPGMRGKILVATKCGIRPAGDPDASAPARYDFSADYIVEACDRSLRRLGISTIDLYLLHRPDYLADPQEVAKAFDKLRTSGKVRCFGISNCRPTLVIALQAACPMPLVAHQVEISLAKLDAFTDGTLDQCLIERLTPMAWSPLAAGVLGAGSSRLLPSQRGYRPDAIVPVLDRIAKERGVSRTTVALAWLLKHPAGIQPVVGSAKPERIREAVRAADLELSREEWYHLLIAARGEPLP